METAKGKIALLEKQIEGLKVSSTTQQLEGVSDLTSLQYLDQLISSYLPPVTLYPPPSFLLSSPSLISPYLPLPYSYLTTLLYRRRCSWNDTLLPCKSPALRMYCFACTSPQLFASPQPLACTSPQPLTCTSPQPFLFTITGVRRILHLQVI